MVYLIKLLFDFLHCVRKDYWFFALPCCAEQKFAVWFGILQFLSGPPVTFSAVMKTARARIRKILSQDQIIFLIVDLRCKKRSYIIYGERIDDFCPGGVLSVRTPFGRTLTDICSHTYPVRNSEFMGGLVLIILNILLSHHIMSLFLKCFSVSFISYFLFTVEAECLSCWFLYQASSPHKSGASSL